MSDLKVVPIETPPNADLVETLEELLEQARSGDVVSGHFCGTTANGEIITSSAATDNMLLEIAAAARLLHRLNQKADGATS